MSDTLPNGWEMLQGSYGPYLSKSGISIEIDGDGDFCIDLDDESKFIHSPLAVIIALFRARGYTVTEPGATPTIQAVLETASASIAVLEHRAQCLTRELASIRHVANSSGPYDSQPFELAAEARDQIFAAMKAVA